MALSGFTPVTLLGKASGKFETFGNKVLKCLFIFSFQGWECLLIWNFSPGLVEI